MATRPLIQLSSVDLHKSSATTRILRTQVRFLEVDKPHLRFLNLPSCNSTPKLKAWKGPMTLTKEVVDEKEMSAVTEHESNEFTTLKHRFLNFKKDKYL